LTPTLTPTPTPTLVPTLTLTLTLTLTPTLAPQMEAARAEGVCLERERRLREAEEARPY
jgi:hypothetical protein